MVKEKHEHRPNTNHKPNIKLSQLIAAALASVTAAFLGSFLGVAGTVTGAGIASVVSTLAGVLYQHSLERTSHTLRAKVPLGDHRTHSVPAEVSALARSVATIRGVWPAEDPADDAAGEQPTERIDPATEVITGQLPSVIPLSARRWWPNWKWVAGGTIAVFLLAMGIVTGVELLHGGPISGGNHGTTAGSLFGQPTERRNPTRLNQQPADQSPPSVTVTQTPSVSPAPASSPPTSTTTVTTTPTRTTTPSSPTGVSSPSSPPPSDGGALPPTSHPFLPTLG